ncbi:MAG: hypothetical protein ABW056_08855 [Thermoanaerobaculia bacterium]
MRRRVFLALVCLCLCSSGAATAQSITPRRPLEGTTSDPAEAGIRAGIALAATVLPNSKGRDPRPTPTPRPVDVVRPDGSSVDAIIAALYECVSHGPEYEPNWTRMRDVFIPVGMIVPPRRATEEAFTVLDVDGFRERVQQALAAAKQKGEPTSFFEKEVARRLDCFGNVCQAFSTYEARHAPFDQKPFATGINSIQLLNDGQRWWVASIVWDTERSNNPIPADYRAQ